MYCLIFSFEIHKIDKILVFTLLNLIRRFYKDFLPLSTSWSLVLYISCSGRACSVNEVSGILLREQQVLSKNIVHSKTVIYATSCRNNGLLYALCLPAGGQAGFTETHSHRVQPLTEHVRPLPDRVRLLTNPTLQILLKPTTKNAGRLPAWCMQHVSCCPGSSLQFN